MKLQTKLAFIAVIVTGILITSTSLLISQQSTYADTVDVYTDGSYSKIAVTYTNAAIIVYPGGTFTYARVIATESSVAENLNTTLAILSSGSPLILRVHISTTGVTFAFNTNSTWYIYRGDIAGLGAYHLDANYNAIREYLNLQVI